jgi:hypothetical protein
MEQGIKLTESKYVCPRCKMNDFRQLLSECVICEPNHLHVRCNICGIEWVETIDKKVG